VTACAYCDENVERLDDRWIEHAHGLTFCNNECLNAWVVDNIDELLDDVDRRPSPAHPSQPRTRRPGGGGGGG
jgi:hypothetical protein